MSNQTSKNKKEKQKTQQGDFVVTIRKEEEFVICFISCATSMNFDYTYVFMYSQC